MAATDAMIARLESELEERNAFVEGLVAGAQDGGRDLSSQEMEMIGNARGRINDLAQQLEPLRATSQLSIQSRNRARELSQEIIGARQRNGQPPVEYRTAGAYIADMYYGALGDREAQERTEIYKRVAAHQTTGDNPGLLPENIVQPVINTLEVSRPITGTLGPTDLGSGAWSYARVTQHTQVGKQAGEKTELASRKMLVTKTPLGADTFGGYVNVSKQDINREPPAILDMIIADLAAQYAIATEAETGSTLWAAGTSGPILPTGPVTGDVIAGAIGVAAGAVFTATGGQGMTIIAISPDMLGVIGPVFAPINPSNAFGSGFSAGNINTGSVGTISGIPVIMSAGLAPGQIVVYSTAAAKTFEHSYGNLQVVEPSVWGVQVGYAGDFDAVVTIPTGVIKVTKTP